MTIAVSFTSVLFHGLFTQVLHIPGPDQLLSIGTAGVHKFFPWQFISYLFVQPFGGTLSLPGLVGLFFDLYFLWVVGSSLLAMKGKRDFVNLFFGGGALVGVLAYLYFLCFHIPGPFAGMKPAIQILLISWCFLFPEARIMLFMTFPVRAKYLVFGWMGVELFVAFSHVEFMRFFTVATSFIFGYSYALLAWEMRGPFAFLHPFDTKMIALKRRCRRLWRTGVSADASANSKIYDLKTRRAVMSDSAFIDYCLDKIAKEGKGALTWRERWKLYRLSKKQRNSR
ncbi:MAG: hypothetical protein OXF02_00145 [Simkaniaceae bacterium]|nr:hypothetical protein [Simkaniaceae bacterium]